jgi:hypothetical protein
MGLGIAPAAGPPGVRSDARASGRREPCPPRHLIHLLRGGEAGSPHKAWGLRQPGLLRPALCRRRARRRGPSGSAGPPYKLQRKRAF